MKLKTFLSIIIFLFSVISLNAFSTLGDYLGIYYLDTSVASIGRGTCGNAYMGDISSATYNTNPAKLAMLNGVYGSYISTRKSGFDLQSYGVAAGTKDIGILIGKYNNSSPIPLIFDENFFGPNGKIFVWEIEIRQLSLGADFSRLYNKKAEQLHLLAGVNCKYFIESCEGSDSKGNIFDLSFEALIDDIIVDDRNSILFDFAFAYTSINFLNTKIRFHIDNDNDGQLDEDNFDLLDNDGDGDIDEDRREDSYTAFSDNIVSLSLSLKKKNETDSHFIFNHFYENQYICSFIIDNRDRINSYGLEISFYDMLFLRYGRVNPDKEIDYLYNSDDTIGLGLRYNFTKFSVYFDMAKILDENSFGINELGFGWRF